jgi:glyceraldehyde 3-phosphate dehydrogenase
MKVVMIYEWWSWHSGMGRIGRLLVRQAFSTSFKGFDVKAINSNYPAATIAHLLKYDTIHGTWKADVSVQEGKLTINGKRPEPFG